MSPSFLWFITLSQSTSFTACAHVSSATNHILRVATALRLHLLPTSCQNCPKKLTHDLGTDVLNPSLRCTLEQSAIPPHQYLITGQRDRPDVSISHWSTYLLLWVRFHISLLYVLSNLLNGLSVINSLPLFTGWWFNPLISSRLVQSGTESYLVNIFR